VRDTHVAIARRAFTLTGPAARPAHLAHDTISRGVYAAVGGGARIAGVAGGTVAAMRAARRSSYRPVTDRPRGNVVVGAVNGAWGDRLSQWGSPLALPMTVRSDDRDVPLDGAGLAAAYPDATDDVVVFLHGLCETDASWRLGGVKHYGDAHSTHGSRLREDCGLTPVYVRYNTGRHICDNGAELAGVLAALVEAWPLRVRRLTLVGHSMGGLVIRAACHEAQTGGAPWVSLVERIVYLGSPHLGAPLEVAVTALGVALRRLPETRPVANALATRSVGIKDLRYGDIRADDRAGVTDLDAWRSEPTECTPLLESAEHYYIGATLGRRPDTVAARVIGDALVPWASASGTGKRRRLALEVDRGRHLGGLHHFDLLNHPRVYAVLRSWLSEG
jgi:pimeloyl-ACP methyl ester carboxylesterase